MKEKLKKITNRNFIDGFLDEPDITLKKVIKLIEEKGYKINNKQNNNNSIDVAMLTNIEPEIIEYLFKKGAKVSENTLKFAIQNNKDQRVIQLIIDNGGKMYDDIIYDAIYGKYKDSKNLEIIDLVIKNGATTNNKNSEYDIIDVAVKTKNTDIVRLILESGAKIRSNHLNMVIKSGDVAMIGLFLEMGKQYIDKNSLDDAIETRNLIIIDMMIKNGARISENSLDNAIKTKDFKIVEMILKNGGKFDENSLEYAVENSNIGMIEYLLANGAKSKNIAPLLKKIDYSYLEVGQNNPSYLVEQSNNIKEQYERVKTLLLSNVLSDIFAHNNKITNSKDNIKIIENFLKKSGYTGAISCDKAILLYDNQSKKDVYELSNKDRYTPRTKSRIIGL